MNLVENVVYKVKAKDVTSCPSYFSYRKVVSGFAKLVHVAPENRCTVLPCNLFYKEEVHSPPFAHLSETAIKVCLALSLMLDQYLSKVPESKSMRAFRKYRSIITIMKNSLYDVDPLKTHFYIVKLWFKGIDNIFLISVQKHRLWVLVRTAHNLWFEQKYEKIFEFLPENFHYFFFMVKFSVYLNRQVFVMLTHFSLETSKRVDGECRPRSDAAGRSTNAVQLYRVANQSTTLAEGQPRNMLALIFQWYLFSSVLELPL